MWYPKFDKNCAFVKSDKKEVRELGYLSFWFDMRIKPWMRIEDRIYKEYRT